MGTMSAVGGVESIAQPHVPATRSSKSVLQSLFDVISICESNVSCSLGKGCADSLNGGVGWLESQNFAASSLQTGRGIAS